MPNSGWGFHFGSMAFVEKKRRDDPKKASFFMIYVAIA
jgi:hypothetical protein